MSHSSKDDGELNVVLSDVHVYTTFTPIKEGNYGTVLCGIHTVLFPY